MQLAKLLNNGAAIQISDSEVLFHGEMSTLLYCRRSLTSAPKLDAGKAQERIASLQGSWQDGWAGTVHSAQTEEKFHKHCVMAIT